MMQKKTDVLAKIAEQRVSDISKIRGILWTALATLFENGAPDDRFTDSIKEKANLFAKPFEQHEDGRFFDGRLGLYEEIESEQPEESVWAGIWTWLSAPKPSCDRPSKLDRAAGSSATVPAPPLLIACTADYAATRPCQHWRTITKTQKESKEPTDVQP